MLVILLIYSVQNITVILLLIIGMRTDDEGAKVLSRCLGAPTDSS